MLFLSSADFFSKSTFKIIISGIPSECQTDWIQIRPNFFVRPDLGPIYKGYKQRRLVGKKLTLKAPLTTESDDIFCKLFSKVSEKNKA